MVVNWIGPQDSRVIAGDHVDVGGNADSRRTLPLCCERICGALVPLAASSTYDNPNGNGKTLVTFNLVDSTACGIPIARVLRGDLGGLVGCDELAELNPNCGSMRLRIEVSNHSPVYPSRELTHAESGLATKRSRPRSA